ncbi:hypothetical protein [Mycobacteroides abscessus]|uniref:hypothetical protein n=1 Tax=Mycobacteroides abscessus TaxID=36809 RepID=UPI000925F98E|nr:hypothetical protein [Mycobacteroides abscessus]MBN7571256.1 hypothetical protein [Mycobacteroides abscessus subsp. abscessus]MDO2978343.1 hypothetical protein [Mycobacteroides abscessus subsp. abscessus]SHQ94331.1 Uncharacterised protein [Mycobacteroides abscessus subsp. abscessus]SHT23340.1 Uncharacterised protein [Mycobacteroides abscessus subsp. abscessus]SHU57898.1 Uncharacterised protein [Mycobacteroides abscessus subsp. abscessus]
MPGISQVTKTGPRTYTPKAGVSIKGGQLVEGVTGGRIQPAAAGSVKVVGVALTDAIAPEDLVLAPTTGSDGRSVLNTVVPPTKVACAYGAIEVPVTYAADAAFGDALVAAANGTVTPAGATPDARAIVGKCTEPGGVVVATKAVGLMRTAI